ncbi:MHYT domain-containing protein [Neobacillus sp. PS3-34]|uniref:MHYT domain-containing protein n=1 Tax=Neobacillus sp. PS3-34 TaxID=3070678 RepID=UPI0027E11142|nr:MHYT domain-containing protein [Neobacillus sp. PS3-34]WML47946.1 MHYT domain-containing protein [Neobacillus sp. PS3-34]
MTESFNPLLILLAIGLTIMASYTALDMFTLLNTSDKNKRSLFLGGSLSLGIGIWVMNFMGYLAADINSFSDIRLSLTFLSILIGTSFTGMAFSLSLGKS